MNAIERMRAAAERLSAFHKRKSSFKWDLPFMAIIITDAGFGPSVEHNNYGKRLPNYDTLEQALDALDAEVDRILNEDDALARTLGVAS